MAKRFIPSENRIMEIIERKWKLLRVLLLYGLSEAMGMKETGRFQQRT